MSSRQASDLTSLSRNTAMKALRDLEDQGFIEATKRGYFLVKNGPATTWRITFKPTNGAGPTNEWQRQSPHGNKTRAQNRSETGAKTAQGIQISEDLTSKMKLSATETSDVSVSATGVEMGPHLIYQGEGLNRRLLHKTETDVGIADCRSHLPLSALRHRLLSVLELEESGGQTRVANAAGIPKGTLSKFKNGGNLASAHRLALNRELARMEHLAIVRSSAAHELGPGKPRLTVVRSQ